jgi:hypothetical protein
MALVLSLGVGICIITVYVHIHAHIIYSLSPLSREQIFLSARPEFLNLSKKKLKVSHWQELDFSTSPSFLADLAHTLYMSQCIEQRF